jgi:acetate kinase
VPLAPLHLPGELELIEAAQVHCPDLPQVACFDTAFHRAMPELAQRVPLPYAFWNEGVRRYGFHGLSYEYVLGVLGSGSRERAVIAHLGNGASLVALRDGRPMDTTMGLTPIGGVVMGTRSGDLDPGVLLYLMKQSGYDASRLEQLVAEESGLRGISGTTSDMKTLLEHRAHDARAAAAVAMFCYSVRKHLGSLAAVLGGVDAVVFTGGIGERAAEVRWEICEGLEHLGIRLDPQRNADHADTISTPSSACTVRVIATNEDLQIARHTYAIIQGPVSAATRH